jgi:thiamine biosynthesis lipoprotein
MKQRVSLRALRPLRSLTAVVVAVLFSVDSPAETADTTRVFRYLMGTSMQVAAFGGDAAVRRTAIDEAFGALNEVDRVMSNYRGDSELSHVNAAAARGPVAVSAPLLAVLEAARRISVDSRGAFDVTVGPLVKLWGFFDKKPHVPAASELAGLRPLVDYRNILIDARERTVRFTRPGVEIDLGGIAKGFAVELAANVLRRHGLSGFVDAGGNQYMLGTQPGKRLWTVGITDPLRGSELLGEVDVREGAVSTSADSSNFLIAGDRRYGHILDPRSLQPSTAALSVTIVSTDATLGDAMSKAAFILGPKDGLALIESYPQMSGVIAYRKADGSTAVALSSRIRTHFHPVALRLGDGRARSGQVTAANGRSSSRR